jgi:Leucine-rich repeat (LRR) protein
MCSKVIPRSQSLRPKYITPNDVNIPIHTNASYHPPIVLRKYALNVSSSVKHDAAFRSLDGFLLLEASGMEFPEDSRLVSLSGKRLNSVVEEDLEHFVGLVYLDLSENYLELHYFENLPKLRELRLCCNEITNIESIVGFKRLQTLDLSYNRLKLPDVQSLYNIPLLRELNLNGNYLKSVPKDICNFRSLEKLSLENNEIANNDIFIHLSAMPTLRELSLAYNFLGSIPQSACSIGSFRLNIQLLFNVICLK